VEDDRKSPALELERQARRQALVAHVARMALAGARTDRLCEEVASWLADELEVSLVEIWQKREDGGPWLREGTRLPECARPSSPSFDFLGAPGLVPEL
jgi:hypothetical protein